jgi:hypothetical protein
LENTPRGRGNISRCHLGKKYEKGKRKRGKCKRKRRKREEIRRMGKENEKRGRKGVNKCKIEKN